MILFTVSARLGRPPSFISVRARRRRRVPTANATNVKHKIKQLAPPPPPPSSQVFYILLGTYLYIITCTLCVCTYGVIAGRQKRFRKRLFTRPDATGSARIYHPGWSGVGAARFRCSSRSRIRFGSFARHVADGQHTDDGTNNNNNNNNNILAGDRYVTLQDSNNNNNTSYSVKLYILLCYYKQRDTAHLPKIRVTISETSVILILY